jgi:hypothetical protein
MTSYEKRRLDSAHGLPPGWKREESVRKKGINAGKIDVYYYSPDGRKVTNKAQMTRLLGSKIDLTGFDFRTGRTLPVNIHRRMRQDANLVLPIRQTASIFKQPVTIVSNHPDSKTHSDLRHGSQEQPRQLFWEKRLEGLFASEKNGEKLSSLQLPTSIQGVTPELVSNENLLHSIAAALHVSSQPITGQTAPRAQLQRNPGVTVNAEQPLMQSVLISDHDIQKQEYKVQEARRRLQQALVVSGSAIN